jgi:hypothetical protein
MHEYVSEHAKVRSLQHLRQQPGVCVSSDEESLQLMLAVYFRNERRYAREPGGRTENEQVRKLVHVPR